MPTENVSRVRLLSERQVPETRQPPDVLPPRPNTDHSPTATEAPPSTPSRREFLSQTLSVIMALATVLSARLILLLAGIGAFVLAYFALQQPTNAALTACAIYDLTIFAPLVWLYATKG